MNEHHQQRIFTLTRAAGMVLARSTRRRLVQSIAGMFAAISLAAIAERESAAAKKRRKHRKRRRRNRGRGNSGGGSGGGTNGGASNYSPDAQERAFLTLINDYRRANGLATLALHDQLGVAAERHSQDQASRNRGGHDGSDGSNAGQRITRAGYDWRAWGENVFWSKPDGSAQAAFIWWKNSPGHNANMLSRNFTEIGIGRVRSNSGWWYWTTAFGRR